MRLILIATPHCPDNLVKVENKTEMFQDLKAGNIHTWIGLCQIDLVSIMSPRPKFQLACLECQESGDATFQLELVT